MNMNMHTDRQIVQTYIQSDYMNNIYTDRLYVQHIQTDRLYEHKID